MLKPQTWQPRQLRRFVTTAAITCTALWITLLVSSLGHNSSPPIFTASCALAVLAWICRLTVWRVSKDELADEKLIERIKCAQDTRTAENREFDDITSYLKDLGEPDGFNT
jgi:hypothetical protein